MNKYEGIFILKPNLNKEEIEKTSSAIVDIITKNGGVVENKEDMGVRQLAYEIKKEKQGHYLLVHFTTAPRAISDMEKTCRLNESILRIQIFKCDITGATLQRDR